MNGEEGSDHPRPVQEKFSGALRWEIFCAFEKKKPESRFHTLFLKRCSKHTPKFPFCTLQGGDADEFFFVFLCLQPSLPLGKRRA